MAQGKLKVKTAVPKNAVSKKSKGTAYTKRANKPSQQKKKQVMQKIKQAISKTVNKSAEEEIRGRACTKTNLSQAQQAVAKHHSKTAS